MQLKDNSDNNVAPHMGAVAMAKVALQHAKDPATKAMAQKIIDDQEREIADMQAWLAKNAKTHGNH